MEELQELVAEVCEEAGYKQLDDLVMTYKRPDGNFATVCVRCPPRPHSQLMRLLRESAHIAHASSLVLSVCLPVLSKGAHHSLSTHAKVLTVSVAWIFCVVR